MRKFFNCIVCLILCSFTWAQAPSDSVSANTDLVKILDKTKRKARKDSIEKIRLLERISQLEKQGQSREAELIDQISLAEREDSIRDQERIEKILGTRDANGHPVAPFSDTLFLVYLKIGPVLPEERAESTNEKIRLLARDRSFNPDSVEVKDNETSVDIIYKDMIILSITEWDALWYDLDPVSIGNDYAGKIVGSISEEKSRKVLSGIFIKIGLVLLILLLTVTLIVVLERLCRKASRWLKSKKDTWFKGVNFKNYEFLTQDRQLQVVIHLVNVSKWVIFVLILYISLPIIFSVFPFTQGWAKTLFAWIWNPAKGIISSVVSFLPNLFSIAIIFLAIRYLVRFFQFVTNEIESERLTLPGFHADWARPTFSIIRLLLYAFMVIAIFPYLPGSDSPIFRGVSVFLGILFSLGSSTAIANAVSGMVITYMRPFKIGDRVKIGEITGDVIEKSLLVTRIKTTKNEFITVPNASVMSGHTVNYTTARESKEGLILHTTVTIGYDIPWRKVHELLIESARKTEGIDVSKDPFVLQTSLDDYYPAYQLNAFTLVPEKMSKIYSELHQNIQDHFNEAGVEILSPHYRAVRDGNMVATPADYLPADYVAPSFNIKTRDE